MSLDEVKVNKKGANIFKEKTKNILFEDRSFGTRFFTAIILSLTFVFSFFFNGPIDIYLSNAKDMAFKLSDILGMVSLISLILFLFLTVFLMVLKGKVYDFFISILFGITLSGYLQAFILNADLGPLDGTAIAWENYSKYALINVFVWMVLIFLPLFIRYYSRDVWTKVIRLGSFFLFSVQLVALVLSPFITSHAKDNVRRVEEGYISKETMFSMSKKDNIVVFIIDRFDGLYLDKLKEKDSNFYENMMKEDLKDFTYYKNVTGSYSRTYPSVMYLLTGEDTDYSIPIEEYTTNSFKNSTFLDELKDRNYFRDILIPAYDTAHDVQPIKEYADNYKEGKGGVNSKGISKKLLQLSAYRYAPHALKPSFWMYTDDLNNMVQQNEYVLDDALFYKGLTEKKLDLTFEENKFSFYHLHGTHDPYVIDENSQRVDRSDITKQTKGVMNITFEYMKQMKELGIYDNSTIIITTDHAIAYGSRELPMNVVPVLFVKKAGQEGKGASISKAPVAQEDFRASVIKAAGGDFEKYGTPFDMWSEDSSRERTHYMSAMEGKKRDSYLRKYSILGDANDFNNWKFIEEHKIKYPFYDKNK